MPTSKIIWINPKTTRELRACNFFGVSSSSYTRKFGQTGVDRARPDNLAIMPNDESGIHAAIDLIRTRYLTLGIFIPYFLGNRWSGDPKKQYGLSLASVMKAKPFIPLSFRYQGDALLRAMAIMENGNPCRTIPPGFFEPFINEEV